MINFRNSLFIKSASSYLQAPNDDLKEILIVGKSNVGKSSLINALCDNSKLAFASSKPGFTKLLNYFNIDKTFYLVDAPGYGYSKSNVQEIDFFAELMENYFSKHQKLKGVLFLLDSRREISEDDLLIFEYLKHVDVKFLIVLTKADKLNQSERHKMTVEVNNKFNLDKEDVIFTSSKNKKGIDILKNKIENLIVK